VAQPLLSEKETDTERADAMLRITPAITDEESTTLKVEGRVVGQWVDELRRECEQCLAARGKLVLDFSGVSFIDQQEVALLKALPSRRVQFVGCSLFLCGLLRGTES
jgi:anti-anti-sigma regulatory factor